MPNRPERDIPKNAKYNYHVSPVRVRSEHCIGYLKGRWSSLRRLRIAVRSQKMLQYASLWVIACVHLHGFARQHEQGDYQADEFFRKGRWYIHKQRRQEKEWRREIRRQAADDERRCGERNETELQEGKERREELKRALYEHLENRNA